MLCFYDPGFLWFESLTLFVNGKSLGEVQASKMNGIMYVLLRDVAELLDFPIKEKGGTIVVSGQKLLYNLYLGPLQQ